MVNGGPGSGIYKTSDGGHTWTKLGGGLPTGRIGRIGLDLYPKNPEIVYAIVESVNPRVPAVEPGQGGGAPGKNCDDGWRSLSHGKRWSILDQDEPRRRERQQQGTLLLQSDPCRSQDVGGKKYTRKAQITKMQGWSIGPTPQIIRSTQGRSSS
jgi:hypothetical protein